MANTDKDWEFWGKNNAHYGVLTDKKFRVETLDRNLDEFFSEGEFYIANRLKELETLLGPVRRNRALDFGCGVGRLAEPLATRFNTVVGLDISPSMLEKARNRAAAHGYSNILYAQSDDALTNAAGEFDFVHTYIVLQHIPTKRGMKILHALLDRIAPGGVASLHLCARREHSLMGQAFYQARCRIPPVNSLINLVRGRSLREPAIQMNEYPLVDVIAAFQVAGIEHVIVDAERHGPYLTAHIAGRRATHQET